MSKVGIGLDIGTSAVKIVELQSGREIKVKKIGVAPLSIGAVKEGVVFDRADVSVTIKELLIKHEIQPKPMVVAIAGQAVNVRRMKMVLQNKKDLADNVRREAERQFTLPLDQINIDFEVVHEDKARKEVEVIMVCARKDIIESHLETLREVGIKPLAMDIQSFALVRAAGLESGKNAGDNVALLDIGEETSDLIIAKDGIPLYTRIIPIAGGSFTKKIKESLGASFVESEELKMSYGDALFDFLAAPQINMEYKVNRVLSEVLKELVQEIRRSLDYFKLQQQKGNEINRFIVSGGGALLPNFIPYLNRELGLNVESITPLKEINCPDGLQKKFTEFFPVFSIAFGLGLRGVTGS